MICTKTFFNMIHRDFSSTCICNHKGRFSMAACTFESLPPKALGGYGPGWGLLGGGDEC